MCPTNSFSSRIMVSVRLRAGLELCTKALPLTCLRRILPIPVNCPFRMLKPAAGLLASFGSGRGDMFVTVIAGQERRSWLLLVENYGFTAAVARTLLRRTVLTPGSPRRNRSLSRNNPRL